MAKVVKSCLKCGATFARSPSSAGKYCSPDCSKGENRIHGRTDTTEHIIWRSMKQRCHNPRKSDYPLYGARGISVCDRWRHSFENFYADMGPRPSMGHTLDRINGDGNYEPGNCRWATKAEQNKNRRGVATPEQDQSLRDCIAQGMNFNQIAKFMGKSRRSVTSRAYRLGLKSGQPPIPKKDRSAQPGLSLPSPQGAST
jgi:hypothetical protein